MKWRKLIATGVLASTLAFGGSAQAASSSSDSDNLHDARTEGYESPVQIDGNTSMLWIMFILLSIVAMSALFKDSRRSRTE